MGLVALAWGGNWPSLQAPVLYLVPALEWKVALDFGKVQFYTRIRGSVPWTQSEKDPTTCSWLASHPVGCHVLCAAVQGGIGLSVTIRAEVHDTLRSAPQCVADLSEAPCWGCVDARGLLSTTVGVGFVDSLRIVAAVCLRFRLVLFSPCPSFRFPIVGSFVSRVLFPAVVLLVAAGFFFSVLWRVPVRNLPVPVPCLHLFAALPARGSALGFASFRSPAVRFAHVVCPSPMCTCLVSYWVVVLLRLGMCRRGARGPLHETKDVANGT